MTKKTIFRPATKNDGPHLARLVNYAGEGMPLYFWQKAAEKGADPWAFGASRAQREEGSFSYTHSTMAEVNGKVAGCLVCYVLPSSPEPIDYDDMPPMFVPIQELEDSAPDTQYVSVLAVYPEFRNMGIGADLLRIAEKSSEGRRMSIVVSDGNRGAERLYERMGYKRDATRTMVKEDWENPGNNWVLMLK
jgi:ribosomal protein S18 acetylase RimI-like enzyme